MGLFKRFRDIIAANFSEMADRFEDPEAMLKQAVREMEESIRAATSETAMALATEKKLSRELDNNRREADTWRRRAEEAVARGDDDGARQALVRKQGYEQIAVALQEQLTASASSSTTLRQQLDAMKAKLAEAKRNLATLSARKKAAEVRKKVYSQTGDVPEVGVENAAFEKFERLREKVEQAEAEADALAELNGAPEAPAPAGSEWSDTAGSTTDAIEEELAALKRGRQS